jgi:MFS family permease
VAEWATGFIVISEEFPVETRGRGLTLFQAVAGIGSIFSGIFLMIFKMLGKLETVIPSIVTPFVVNHILSWRGMYILGALPLLLILYLKKNYTETPQFQKIKDESTKPSVFEVFKPQYRKYMILVSLLWFFSYLCYATAVMYFPTHVQTVHGWQQAQSGMATSIAFIIGMIGFPVAGILLDSIGRKKTSIIFFVGGAIGATFAFQAPDYYSTIIALVIGTFFVSVFTVLCASFTNELFPTKIRASASAWGNNIFGRMAQIAAPFVVGYLAAPMGNSGHSATLMIMGAVVAAFIVIFLPETKGMKVDEDTGEIVPVD